MQWLQNLDISSFRFVNGRLANPLFDQIMPFLSGNAFFFPVLIVLGLAVIWKFRGRGVVFLLLLTVAIALSDGIICRTIKHAIGRDRPFVGLPEVRCLLGQGGSGSMPSSHAANWFAATMVAYVFFRRSLRVMLPLACAVSFSRVYCGVHYPSDVAAGAVLGGGTAGAVLWLVNDLWRWAGRKWFPLWWERFPSVLSPPRPSDLAEEEEPRFAPRRKPGEKFPAPEAVPAATLDEHWLRFGYVTVGLLLIARLAYIGSNVIELSPSEASQWLSSKHMPSVDLSHSGMAKVLTFAGTSIWGDNQFGVRFFAPLLSAVTSLLLLRFFAKNVNARAGFFLVLILTAVPALPAGATLLDDDFLQVFFLTAAIVAGWRAVQPQAHLRSWVWAGLWLGLSSRPSLLGIFPWLSLLLFMIWWRPARQQFRKPGLYAGLAISFALFLLMIRLSSSFFAGATARLWPKPIGSYPYLKEAFLLNALFGIPALWAAVAFWRRHGHQPLLLYCFCLGVPAFGVSLFFVPSNWSAPAATIVPLLCLMTIFWDVRFRLEASKLKPWFSIVLTLSLGVVLLGHETNWSQKIIGRPLPVNLDPLASVRGWSDCARIAEQARRQLSDGTEPAFLIAQNAGLAGELSFYLRRNFGEGTMPPSVCTVPADGGVPEWQGYSNKGAVDALFVREFPANDAMDEAPLHLLRQQFESVTDLGVKTVNYHGQVLRSLQFFACRNLK